MDSLETDIHPPMFPFTLSHIFADKNGNPVGIDDRCAIDQYPDSQDKLSYRFIYDHYRLAFVLECQETGHLFSAWTWSNDRLRILNIEKIGSFVKE